LSSACGLARATYVPLLSINVVFGLEEDGPFLFVLDNVLHSIRLLQLAAVVIVLRRERSLGIGPLSLGLQVVVATQSPRGSN
jgi:hypothetical protein